VDGNIISTNTGNAQEFQMPLNTLSSLLVIAAALGQIAGAACSGWDDVEASAEQIRADRAAFRIPERDAFGEIEGLHALILIATDLGADRDDLRRINRAATDAAHTAEDDAILAEAR